MLDDFDYTVVIGVDEGHLEHLRLVLPTWKKYKPSLFNRPWVVFYDVSMSDGDISTLMDGLNAEIEDCDLIPWPLTGVKYESDPSLGRFGDAQRYKMLSGFVHVPAQHVITPYWLKLDLDVVATGMDAWIAPQWFDDNPVIIGHPWGYTKPPNQMQVLDQWVCDNREVLPSGFTNMGALNLVPEPNATCLSHNRIISWCAFFSTEFTNEAALFAHNTCGKGKLPVPSQDGYLWYCAERMRLPIIRTKMKSMGWKHCANLKAVKDTVRTLW